MPWPENSLNDDEEVVLDRRPHWTFLLGPMGIAVLGFLVMIFFIVVATAFWWAGVIIFLLALMSLGVNVLRWRTIQFIVTTDRIMTRVGIIGKQGTEIPLDRVMNISYRQSAKERVLGVGDLVIESAGENGQQYFTDVSHPSHVQNIIYKQTEIYSQRGPNNGLGDDSPAVARPGNGMGGGRDRSRNRNPAAAHGLERRDEKERQRVGGDDGQNGHSQDDKGGDQQGGGSSGGGGIPDQIEALDRLRQRGILTEDEFRDKKKQLLDRL